MANGHGGARPGAGRKKKALSEKIINGNPGKAPLTKLQFSVQDIGFEICEDGLYDGTYFAKVYREAVELCAYGTKTDM